MSHTGKREPRDLPQGSRQGTDERDDQTDHTKHDGAGPVVGQGVHHDRKGQNMTSHDEDEE